MFSAQSLLVGNGTSVTCLRKSREPITALNVATYVTSLMVRKFWLCYCTLQSFNDLHFSSVQLHKEPQEASSLTMFACFATLRRVGPLGELIINNNKHFRKWLAKD